MNSLSSRKSIPPKDSTTPSDFIPLSANKSGNFRTNGQQGRKSNGFGEAMANGNNKRRWRSSSGGGKDKLYNDVRMVSVTVWYCN